MSLFEEWPDEDDELDRSRRSRPPASYTLVDHGRLFRRLFPKQRYTVFFRQLNFIAKRKLSFSERDQVMSACCGLLLEKEYVETEEDLRSQLKSNAEDLKINIERFEEIYSLAEPLLERISSLDRLTFLNVRSEVQRYHHALYAPLEGERASAPIKEVLRRIVNVSKDEIKDFKSKTKRGPLPDAALRKCISEAAQVFGEKKATASHSRKEGRRTSPFIDFVQLIFLALPENAMIGRHGRYTAAAIETHVAAVCKDLKKGLRERNKKPKLAD